MEENAPWSTMYSAARSHYYYFPIDNIIYFIDRSKMHWVKGTSLQMNQLLLLSICHDICFLQMSVQSPLAPTLLHLLINRNLLSALFSLSTTLIPTQMLTIQSYMFCYSRVKKSIYSTLTNSSSSQVLEFVFWMFWEDFSQLSDRLLLLISL